MPDTIPTIEPGVADDRGRDGMLLRFPFHEGAVEDLKEEVATPSRRWQPDLGGWWVAREYRDTAVHVLLSYFPEVMILGEAGEDDELLARDGSRLAQGRLF
jgi:hypothetical protein